MPQEQETERHPQLSDNDSPLPSSQYDNLGNTAEGFAVSNHLKRFPDETLLGRLILSQLSDALVRMEIRYPNTTLGEFFKCPDLIVRAMLWWTLYLMIGFPQLIVKDSLLGFVDSANDFYKFIQKFLYRS